MKRIITFLLTLLMMLSCLSCLMPASAEEATDPYAPANEELQQMFTGEQGAALGSFGKGQSFGAMVSVPEGKRLTQINFHALATYNNNSNTIVFRVYQWNNDYQTTVQGQILAQVTKRNQVDNDPLDIKLPTNRNLTGDLLWTATFEGGEKQITPWKAGGPVGATQYFSLGNECDAFCFSITMADALTTLPATHTATFVAEGTEIGKITFFEGDTELYGVPECPPKEGFYADWETYTLGKEDITINAVYSDASGAVKPGVPDATHITAFAEVHNNYLIPEGCYSQVNRDGTASFVGSWEVDDDIDAYVTINYCTFMVKYFEGYSSRNDLPNKNHKYNVVAFKVKAPAVSADSMPNLLVTVGRNNTEVYCNKVANTIKCDGNEEYWIFDFSDESDFSSDFINTMKLNWAYSMGTEENLNAEFVLMGFQFFDTLDDAMRATGGEEMTEAPTEAPTEVPTEVPTEAPTTPEATEKPAEEPREEKGCASMMASATVVLTAVAAAYALKKKN